MTMILRQMLDLSSIVVHERDIQYFHDAIISRNCHWILVFDYPSDPLLFRIIFLHFIRESRTRIPERFISVLLFGTKDTAHIIPDFIE